MSENIPIKELLSKVTKGNEGYEKLKQYFEDLDFTEELEKEPALWEYLRRSILSHAPEIQPPLNDPNAPELNDDLSNYFVINNMPVAPEEKVPKLFALVHKFLANGEITVQDEDIEIPLDEEKKTCGVAFVKMANEEQARQGASLFEGFPLGGKKLATCLMPEFNKIMQTTEQFEMPQAAADLEDLRAPIFDIKREQFLYKAGKNVQVDYFDRQQAVNSQPTESLASLENCSDKPTSWSPSGTYLIVIKPTGVLFLGGKDMIPIITIPQANVEAVSMSPCEKYVLTYAPKSATAFTVWDFQMVT